jgi:hypothetical protein
MHCDRLGAIGKGQLWPRRGVLSCGSSANWVRGSWAGRQTKALAPGAEEGHPRLDRHAKQTLWQRRAFLSRKNQRGSVFERTAARGSDSGAAGRDLVPSALPTRPLLLQTWRAEGRPASGV